jgi:hypothetical protein
LKNVYAFVRANQFVIVRLKTKRHVCDQPLDFQANVKIEFLLPQHKES